MKKKKERIMTIAAIVVFIAGAALLLYPTVSDMINNMHQTQFIVTYREDVKGLNDETYQAMLEAAREYNSDMSFQQWAMGLDPELREEYESLLDLSGLGIMGYIDIPSINTRLPIYHGSSDEVLAVGVGHLEWTSLPVGGESTHCVLSGHRGLPSAYLFTDLDQLSLGDRFTITVLDDQLTYEIDRIITVLPEETDYLKIVEGEDYCTLMTCTPYGINTHRLLLRGVRVDPGPKTLRISSDAEALRFWDSVIFVMIPMLMILLIALVMKQAGKKKKTA